MQHAVAMVPMVEPHASELRRLLQLRAGGGGRPSRVQRASHRARARTATDTAKNALVEREEQRLQRELLESCPILEEFAGRAPRVLDVGCSTGASTVAVALSPVLDPTVVVGADPDALAVLAAEARARACGLPSRRVAFVRIRPGEPLPFARDSFDLVVCLSLLELVPTRASRRCLLGEMKRVVRPGGYLFAVLPRSQRAPRGWRSVPVDGWVLGQILRRAGVPAMLRPLWLMRLLSALGAVWRSRRLLARKAGVDPARD